jgi:pimeloyl-ACP methyl ester carboxylesterase
MFAVLTLVALSLLTALATSPDAATGGRSAHLSGAAKDGITWHGCGKQLQCANVQVPLDWSHPRGAKIKLAAIRHLASRPGTRIGSLFVNPGGPGGSVAYVRDEGNQLDAAGGGRFDVVGWDARGTGRGALVRCFSSEGSRRAFFRGWVVPTTSAASPRYVRKTGSLARRCGALSGPILRHMSTADTVRDLEYLRRLVGDRRLTYLGRSYGTFIGQTYANLFPNRVRAMVLDGVLDPVSWVDGLVPAYQDELSFNNRALAQILSLCQRAGPARCALAGHGPVAPRVDALFARLRRGSIPARSAKPPGRLAHGDALAGVAVETSGGPANWPTLARHLEAAIDGDGSGLLEDARFFTNAFTTPVKSPGLPAVGITCADSVAGAGPSAWPRVVRQMTRVSYIFGPLLVWWRWAPCASWPVRSAHRYTGPWNARTPNPILVIGTTNDPQTPYRAAKKTARRLGNAVLLTHDGYGHTSNPDPSTCVKRTTRRYLVHLATPSRGKVCPSDRQPFDPNFGKPLP